ncbi:HIT domain-containing protein [Mycobacterium sp. IS-836]|uniref:HIT domain-containing protein n=1 Tax=Mycobacterium sp. IS-836 TaxID=1834160 RepID=UPI00096F355D
MSTSARCILCDARDGAVPAALIYKHDLVFAIDVPPDSQSYIGPVHFLVIPTDHFPSVVHVTDDDGALCSRLLTVAANLSRDKNIADSGFRLVANTGPDANQTVSHFHVHCIGGRRLRDDC